MVSSKCSIGPRRCAQWFFANVCRDEITNEKNSKKKHVCPPRYDLSGRCWYDLLHIQNFTPVQEPQTESTTIALPSILDMRLIRPRERSLEVKPPDTEQETNEVRIFCLGSFGFLLFSMHYSMWFVISNEDIYYFCFRQ